MRLAPFKHKLAMLRIYHKTGKMPGTVSEERHIRYMYTWMKLLDAQHAEIVAEDICINP